MDVEKVPLTEENFPEIRQRLKDDPAFVEAFTADPGAALASVGYFVTEETWEKMNTSIQLGITAVVDDAREQVPEGMSKATTVTVSLDDVPGN